MSGSVGASGGSSPGLPGELVHINDKAGDAHAAAHLLEFDSVHGRWKHAVSASATAIQVDSQAIGHSQACTPGADLLPTVAVGRTPTKP
ncbi:MAG: glyceraldehyde 3-phosphate dehydrogenase NAD-binding domain-containing protein [Cyanobium sp.]